jgi:ribonuclease G
MTRQNVTDGVREIMTKHCPTCGGEGVVKSEETIAIEVERRLRELAHQAGDGGPEAYLVRLNPKVTHHFTADGARMLHALEEETGRFFHFTGSEGLPLDHFAIVAEGSREEITEQAVPFRAGEEVHVDIVEPHMFNDDDAVAKVDGYLIEVVNGIPYVGEKKLVRIEEAGRTAARAVLTGTEAEEAAAAAEERKQARMRQERSRKGAQTRARRREEAEAAEKKPAGRSRGRSKKASEDGEGSAEEAAEAVEALTEDGTPEAGTGPAALSEAENGDGAVDSKPRRRGRRGGRRRSRAKAGADAPDTSDVSE